MADSTTKAAAKAEVEPLKAGGSSTVFPITGGQGAAAYWRSNAPAADAEYWSGIQGGEGEKKYQGYTLARTGQEVNLSEMHFSEYWGKFYGFESDEGGDPPFEFTVGLSHSGTGVEKVHDGITDIGQASASVQSEKPDWGQDVYDKFVDHVVGVDGQPIVVSKAIYDNGVTGITGEELKGLYRGEYDNWKDLGGPDRKIQILGRVKGSGTRTAFVSNVFGDSKAQTTVSNRFGQNQRLASAIQSSDNAISYLALAFLNTRGVEPITLDWEGTTYGYKGAGDGKSLSAKEYPLSRDLHAYTYDGTSKKEAAILNLVLENFGQKTFVEPNDYFMLSDERQQNQLDKLPEPETIPE
jgi:phosphate transport system substrate-binding protein